MSDYSNAVAPAMEQPVPNVGQAEHVFLYWIFDAVAGRFVGSPQLFASDAMAKRAVKAAMSDSTYLGTDPHDFTLFCLGQLDQVSGAFESCVAAVCNVSELAGKAVRS